MLENATVVEILWSLASGAAAVIHLWLTLQAYLDWTATWSDHPARQRGISAGWYFVGQFCLFLPKLIELAIGVYSMTVPSAREEVLSDAAALAQAGLIAGEVVALAGALAFWMARRALAAWADERK